MKKDMLRGIAALAVVLILYILIAFLIPFPKTAVFWASFLFTLVAFAVAVGALYLALVKRPDARSRFYGFPIARIGVIYWLVQLVLGLIFMALGTWIPAWAAVLVYAAALGAAAIGLISADAVVEEIQVQDQKLKKDVSFMRSVRSKVNQMANQCSLPEVKRFAEDIRYADPVSSEPLAEIEGDLSAAAVELQAAVLDGSPETIRALCQKASAILSERNRLCKLHKNA